jgi:hypothetical protein
MWRNFEWRKKEAERKVDKKKGKEKTLGSGIVKRINS